MPPPSKKRKLQQTSAGEEIAFDPEARREYLTGFHKRKLQRAKQAQEAAEKRARADRIEERKKLREERKADLARHVQEVNALLRPTAETDGSEGDNSEDSSDDEFHGLEEVPLPPVDHEAEYVDEEKYTTVTVEEIDVSREGFQKATVEAEEDVEDSEAVVKTTKSASNTSKNAKRSWTKEKPDDRPDKAKKKRKKFRYENKAERKFTRMKEKSKNSKQAKARRTG